MREGPCASRIPSQKKVNVPHWLAGHFCQAPTETLPLWPKNPMSAQLCFALAFLSLLQRKQHLTRCLVQDKINVPLIGNALLRQALAESEATHDAQVALALVKVFSSYIARLIQSQASAASPLQAAKSTEADVPARVQPAFGDGWPVKLSV
jgi:hypothetical protein